MSDFSNQELLKVVDFVNSCNDMIDGKFILADVKIRKILSIIESSDELLKFITSCSANFNFERELQRAEVKNKFNGGVFVCPQDSKTLIALVFCLLVAFDTKKMDFYQFIQQNFETLAPNGEYANFTKNLLIPFRDYVSSYFGIGKSKNAQGEETTFVFERNNEELENNEESPQEEKKSNASIFKEIEESVRALIDVVYADRKLKEDKRQQLLYVLKCAKYSIQFEDMKLISGYITCFDCMAEKIHNLKFLLNELKNKIKEYYDNL